MQLSIKAAELRFDDKREVKHYANQLLNVVRDEDQGNDLYTVYNRIQENLTQSDRMIDMNGNIIGGVDNMFDDVRLNKELFELVTI
jgi:DNA-binding ferritin-like protein (Dps family)